MTTYRFSVTIPATGAAPVNLAAAAIAAPAIIAGYDALFSTRWLPAARLILQVAVGSTGFVFIGDASVTSAGTNSNHTLKPGSPTTNPGDDQEYRSEDDWNDQNLGQVYIHGTHQGDVVFVEYSQV